MQVTIDGDELVIRCPLQEPTLSATGKTLLVASSHGNATTQAMIDGKPIVIGLNAYIYAGDKKPRGKRAEIVKAELVGGAA